MEFFLFSLEFDDESWFVIGTGFNFEGPEFDIFLDDVFLEFSSDESFGVEDGVHWVSGDLVFGGVTDKSFGFGEGDV